MKDTRISGKKIEEMFEGVARWGRIAGYEENTDALRVMYESQYFAACMLFDKMGILNEFHKYEAEEDEESRD